MTASVHTARSAFNESIGIRELRQHASRIIEAAEGGTTYRVTNHGKDTGVRIGKGDATRRGAEPERRRGATPDQVVSSGVYDSPKPEGLRTGNAANRGARAQRVGTRG